MPKKPSFPHHKYSSAEQRYFEQLLINCTEYKEQTLVGPDKSTNKKGQCILVEDHPFHNPYYPRGPKKLSIQQLAYIVKHKVLPDNTGIRNTRDQFDLSHVCHRDNCINMRDRHIVAEEHWKNKHRQKHHTEILQLFKDICLHIMEIAKTGCKKMFRSNTKQKAYICCVDCPDLCKGCCNPPCFKNFNSCCSSLLTESN